jgi:signal transduction histidine kinase
MGFAAASVAERDAATVLAEQLGQATQRLYAAQQELAESRTLAAVGEMAAGAAHEINNPLAIVVGRAELMAESAQGADRQTWQIIAQQAQRISDIISEMMEFARPAPPQPRLVDLAELLDSVRQAAQDRPATRQMELQVEVAPDTPPALADAQQIIGVLLELLSNAAAAYAADPRARIEASAAEVDGGVLLRVIDQGCGMDGPTLEKAFTPFFSAKPAGRSRGLGLSRARRLVQINGGRIWLQSQPREGTTAYVLLPGAAAVDTAQSDSQGNS